MNKAARMFVYTLVNLSVAEIRCLIYTTKRKKILFRLTISEVLVCSQLVQGTSGVVTGHSRGKPLTLREARKPRKGKSQGSDMFLQVSPLMPHSFSHPLASS